MNGKYEVEREDWEKLDMDSKLWMMFNTFNSYRAEAAERVGDAEKRISALEKRKRWDTAFSGVTGVIGGGLAVLGKAILGK